MWLLFPSRGGEGACRRSGSRELTGRCRLLGSNANVACYHVVRATAESLALRDIGLLFATCPGAG